MTETSIDRLRFGGNVIRRETVCSPPSGPMAQARISAYQDIDSDQEDGDDTDTLDEKLDGMEFGFHGADSDDDEGEV